MRPTPRERPTSSSTRTSCGGSARSDEALPGCALAHTGRHPCLHHLAGLHRLGWSGSPRYAPRVIRFVVVDDHPAIVAAIAAAVEHRADLALVGTASSADEAIHVVETTGPDVVVCDVWLAGSPGGLDVLAAIGRRRATRLVPQVLVLSGFDQPSFLRAAFEGGAAGYLSKASPVEEIV